jgi:hypothetical protein
MYFLGKSKSEHFLGFLPFFSLIDTGLSLLVIQLSDMYTQLFLLIFALSNLIYNNISKLFLTLFSNAFTVNNNKVSSKLPNNFNNKKTQNNFNNKANKISNLDNSYLKLLYHLIYIQNITNKVTLPQNNYSHLTQINNYNITIKLINSMSNKILLNFILINRDKCNYISKITTSESIYSIKLDNNNKQFNMVNSLNNLYKFIFSQKSLNRLDFNLYNNLNIAKEQRWLTKNSLLTEFLSKNSNLDIVCNGIEDIESANVIEDLNCDYQQGFLYSKPVFKEDIVDTIRKIQK